MSQPMLEGVSFVPLLRVAIRENHERVMGASLDTHGSITGDNIETRGHASSLRPTPYYK